MKQISVSKSIDVIGQEPACFETNGTCSRCGACCSAFLPLTQKDIRRIREFLKTNPRTACNHNPQKASNVVDLLCPFLDTSGETCACTIYDARPDICRCYRCSLTGDEGVTAIRDEMLKRNGPLSGAPTLQNMTALFFPERLPKEQEPAVTNQMAEDPVPPGLQGIVLERKDNACRLLTQQKGIVAVPAAWLTKIENIDNPPHRKD